MIGVKDDDRSFRAHFGTSVDVCLALWEWIRVHPRRPLRGMQPKHLMWTLLFLKVYDTEDVLSSRVGTTRKTFRRWIWRVLLLIQTLKRRVVSCRRRRLFFSHRCG